MLLATHPGVARADGPIASGETLDGAISTVGEEDTWTFTASIGEKVVIRIARLSGDNILYPKMRLYAPNDALLATAFANPNVTEIAVTAASSGTFTVLVSSGGPSMSGVGTYRLRLAKMPGPFVMGEDGEALTNGGNHDGTIDLGDLDFWTLTAGVGEKIVLRIARLSGDTILYPTMRLYAPDGALLAADFANSHVAEIAVTAASSGTFTVLVSSGGPSMSGVGTYRLRLAKMPGPFVMGEDGGALTNGGNHDGTIDLGDLDFWTLTAGAGEKIVLRIARLAGSNILYPTMRLYAPDGALLAAAFANPDVTEIAVTAASSGTFTVLVSSGGPSMSGVGTYALRLAKMPGPFVVGDDGGALTNGGNHDGTIDLGDLDLWSLNAVEGGSITLEISKLTGNTILYPTMRLYAPSGELLGSAMANPQVAEMVVPAPSSGTFTVLVGSGGPSRSGTGTYRLTASGIVESCTTSGDSDSDGIGETTVTGGCAPCSPGQSEGCLDNCPGVANPDQDDADEDGVGDACDDCHGCVVCSDWADSACPAIPGCEAGFCNIVTGNCECVTSTSPVVYAALGDSYSAGEGTGDYLEGTGSGAGGNRCHRSPHAYARLLKLRGHGGKSLFELSGEEDSGFGMEFVACSGAKSTNVSYAVGFDDGKEFNGESVQVWAIGTDPAPDLVTLTVGGNDVGFAEILKHCVKEDDCHNKPPPDKLPHNDSHATLKEWAPAAINARIPEWSARFRALKSEFPAASIFVLGYPRLVSGEPCFATRFLAVGYSWELEAAEQAEIRLWADLLNTALGKAAREAGVHFVPVARYFENHEVCAFYGRDWIIGISERAFFLDECSSCFHPKRRGQEAYAQAFGAYLHKLRIYGSETGFTSAGLPRNPVESVSAQQSLSQRGAGEIFGRLGPLEITPSSRSDCATRSSLFPGGTVRLRGEGFAASSPVTIHIADDDGDVLDADGTADAQGEVDLDVVAPAGLPVPALVEFRVAGVSANGAPLVLLGHRLSTLPPGQAPDSDGDGISDGCDPCPELFGDDVDSDADGFGDGCDPCPLDPENDFDGDGKCANQDPCPLDFGDDQDLDGVCDGSDNCPGVSNADQEDVRQNGVGDACDLCPDEAPDACPVAGPLCGDVNGSESITAGDALAILRAAVGGSECVVEPCLCDVSGNGSIAASDALAALRIAVGQTVDEACPCD